MGKGSEMPTERIRELRQRIAEINEELEPLIQQRDNFELDIDEYTDKFDQMLNDTVGVVEICGIEFEPSRILQELDPTAYRIALNNFIADIDIEDDPEYKSLVNDIDDLEYELEKWTDDADELEAEYWEEQKGE